MKNNILRTILFILIVNVLTACGSGTSSQNNNIKNENTNKNDTQIPYII